MKNFLLSIFAVMLAVFSVQAEKVTLNASDVSGKGVSGGGTNSSFTFDVSPISFDFSNAYGDGSLIRMYKSSTLTIAGATITKIEFTASSSKYGGAVTANVGAVTVSGTTQTWEGSSNEVVITATNSQIRTGKIVVTYTTAGGGDTPALETLEKPVIAPDSQEFSLGESVNVTISAAEGATIYYTTDGENPTEESNVYENALTITETTIVKAIAVMEGYNNSAVAEATYTAVDPNAIVKEIVASETGIANGVEVETLKFGNVTATFNIGSGSNPTKYYASGTAFRAYGGNTITFTGDAGVTINSVVFTFGTGDGSNDITADCGTYTDGTWTGASNEVKFTISGTSGNRRLAKITVTYSVEEGVVVIATPSIAGEATFVGSTTVEITNNEEGTTLYYSTNGVDYAAYTGALTISETTTVYAKAVDAQGNESSVAEATFTKLETLSIADAKAAYDAAGADVEVAMDLTGAVVTVNSGQYLFIENETTGINIYNSSADYAVGTKFTSGYVLGTSTTYRNMHQLSNVEFCGVETTTTTVEPLEVTIADIAGNYDEYEGRFVKLEGVSIASDLTMTQNGDEYKAYDRFTLGFGAIANCDVTGVVAIYNTGEQLYIKDITYNLTVSDVEYATLFLDFAAAIPAGVEAYVVESAEGGYVDLVQIEGVLPANTGVILKNAGTYTFTYSTETAATIETNLLLGTAVDTDIDVEAYVLSKQSEGVGFYKAQMTDDTWLNNANKAYLPASAVTTSAASLSFRFPGTTGVEEITDNREQSTVIYDLTGRRVDAITAPGIYIVNGKKVLVK